MDFTHDVLEADKPADPLHACIFGMWNAKRLGPQSSRAFLRHAYNVFYHDFANVDIKASRFVWQVTFREAVLSFRSAVLRYAVGLRQLHATRRFTNHKKMQAPKEAYDTVGHHFLENRCLRKPGWIWARFL